MAKDKLTDYDATASNNTDVGGISVAEGMLPSGVNNAIREQMSHLKDFASGTTGIDVLSLADDDASHAIKLQAPSAVTADTTFTLPDGDGVSGQTMITDGAGTLAWAAPYGNRNLIINGAMQVAQRGSVTGITGAGVYGGADRFPTNGSGFGTVSLVQEADAPEGFAYSQQAKVTTARSTSGAADHFIIGTRLEGQDLQRFKKGTSNAEYMTVSFYAKASQATTIQLELYDSDNSRHAGKEFAITTSWARYSYSFVGDTTGAFNNDNSLSLYVFFWLGAGTTFTSGTNPDGSWIASTNNRRVNSAVGTTFMDTLNAEFNLTGVQLEVGSTATPFEHRSFAEEWDRCQRYCTVYNVGGGNTHPQNLVSPNHPVPGAAGHVDVGNRAEWFMSYPVKRSQPTITVTDPTNMRWLANGSVVVDANGSVSFPVGTGHQNANVFQNVPSSISTSSVPEGWLYKGSGTNPVITIDAEL